MHQLQEDNYYMRFFKKTRHGILLAAVCFLLQLQTNAQNWDINTLRNINPENPTSSFWKATSNSVYVVSVGAPVGIWVTGALSKDRETKIKAYELLGSVAIAGVITQGLKITIDRPRPYEKYDGVYPDKIEEGQSFPSGHTTLAFATVTSLTLQYKKWYIAVPAYAWAAGVGYSRMYLGQHYPSDVIAGAVVGTGSAFLSHWLSDKIFRKK